MCIRDRLLEDFVIPIMYKNRIPTSHAWAILRPYHARAFWKFILYALWKFALGIVAGTAIVAAGLVTCCIGFILMAIPYLGAVITLPVSVFFRFLGPDFLRQFGEDFDILPHIEEYQEPQFPSIPSASPPDNLS